MPEPLDYETPKQREPLNRWDFLMFIALAVFLLGFLAAFLIPILTRRFD